ncbi:MAG TPA: C40 family peptidase [Acetivibrio sp.]|nr:C40 family peptidase [Acetivibrio sp.]
MKRTLILLLNITMLYMVLCSCDQPVDNTIEIPSPEVTAGGEAISTHGKGEDTTIPSDEGDKIKGGSEGVSYDNVAVVLDTVVDVFREPDITSERVTQAIFNQPVTILEEKDSWVKVKVVDGYTGWLRSKYIDRDCSSIMKENFTDKAVVTEKTQKVYSGAGGGVTLKDVVMGTELYIKNKKDRYFEVVLPGNITGWIETKGTIKVPVESPIPKTSAQDFLATVKKFMETQYLWGGVSAWQGLDCSGLVYICSRINGVNLPRDADMQYDFIKTGPQNTGGLKPGDLLFFSSNEDLANVSHVGIYLGEDQFIHASQSAGKVTYGSINSEYYKKRLKGIRRIFE